MKILRTDVENLANEKKMLYKLTKGTSTSFKDMTDEELDQSWPVDAFLIYEDENRSGGTVTLITIISGNHALAGQSKPFIESFEEILDIMDGEPFSIHIHKLTSNKNRSFYTATLDC